MMMPKTQQKWQNDPNQYLYSDLQQYQEDHLQMFVKMNTDGRMQCPSEVGMLTLTKSWKQAMLKKTDTMFLDEVYKGFVVTAKTSIIFSVDRFLKWYVSNSTTVFSDQWITKFGDQWIVFHSVNYPLLLDNTTKTRAYFSCNSLATYKRE